MTGGVIEIRRGHAEQWRCGGEIFAILRLPEPFGLIRMRVWFSPRHSYCLPRWFKMEGEEQREGREYSLPLPSSALSSYLLLSPLHLTLFSLLSFSLSPPPLPLLPVISLSLPSTAPPSPCHLSLSLSSLSSTSPPPLLLFLVSPVSVTWARSQTQVCSFSVWLFFCLSACLPATQRRVSSLPDSLKKPQTTSSL